MATSKINALADLKQWKGQFNQTKNGGIARLKHKGDAQSNNAPSKALDSVQPPKKTLKPFNPFALKLAQCNRMFDLTRQAIERCKRDYPDYYYHKRKMATECNEIVRRLNDGRALIKRLTAYTAEQDPTQQATIKESLQAINYLSVKFKELADYVAQVDGNGDKLESLDNKTDLEV
ncbi:hypothetical protein [Caviibacterium pharyngocola]|uniref:Uncharacterized protein n=1 Tax=Caviibacterium pharyngocola TaxID=28159 RepID=A0A2M8RSW3_9PAST|nr:hypothetical protein [Caviibacterium pharyngocola]PJG81973.1 hypothetical protein CVP04_11370 [Caviibacterium pharyngocola]